MTRFHAKVEPELRYDSCPPKKHTDQKHSESLSFGGPGCLGNQPKHNFPWKTDSKVLGEMITSHVRSELDFLRAEGQEGPPKKRVLLQHVTKKLRFFLGVASCDYFIPLVSL